MYIRTIVDSVFNMSDSEIKVIKCVEEKKHKKHKKKEETESEPEPESEEEETESESEEEESSEDSDNVSVTTTDILSNDPLYFVLSKIFMTKDGVNLADVLQEISNKLPSRKH